MTVEPSERKPAEVPNYHKESGPKATFVKPKLTPHGDMVELTQQSGEEGGSFRP